MSRKIYKPKEILAKLREVEILTAQGRSAVDAIRAIGRDGCDIFRGARNMVA